MLPSNQLDAASSFVCHSEWASSKSNGIYTTDMPINLLIHIGMIDCDCRLDAIYASVHRFDLQ